MDGRSRRKGTDVKLLNFHRVETVMLYLVRPPDLSYTLKYITTDSREIYSTLSALLYAPVCYGLLFTLNAVREFVMEDSY